jgi:hypothetical protein
MSDPGITQCKFCYRDCLKSLKQLNEALKLIGRKLSVEEVLS